MSNNVTSSIASKNAACNARTALLNVGGAGYRDVYSGVQPVSPDVAVTTQVRLAHVLFSATAFASAVNGVATANAMTPDPSPVAGVATWFRDSSGAGVAVTDGSVGISGCDMNLATTTVTAGLPFSVTVATYAEP